MRCYSSPSLSRERSGLGTVRGSRKEEENSKSSQGKFFLSPLPSNHSCSQKTR